MQERYRADYDGEFIILKTTYRDGKKVQEKEWIENPIENHYISARAAIIGPGSSRNDFPIKRLENHKGGLLGKKRLQSYGCKGSWLELKSDFYIDRDHKHLESIIANKFNENSTVYSDSKNCIKYPGEFYLVPYNLNLSSDQALAMYIAAFDGHKEIFCLGLDSNEMSEKELKSIEQVIKTYSSTDFIFVRDNKVMPHIWKKYRNVSRIEYTTFISHCDV